MAMETPSLYAVCFWAQRMLCNLSHRGQRLHEQQEPWLQSNDHAKRLRIPPIHLLGIALQFQGCPAEGWCEVISLSLLALNSASASFDAKVALLITRHQDVLLCTE